MLRLGRFRKLLDDVKFDLCNTPSNHSQRFGRSMRDVDNSSANERTAVIDPNCHGPPSSDVCHAQPGAEWQRTMSGGQFARIEPFAARGLCSFCVEAGSPCDATCVSAAFLYGVCFFVIATRLFVTNDVVRLCSSDACRLATDSSDFWVTMED